VRAVGLGVAREIEKRADALPARVEAPPPPPPVPTKDFFGRTAFVFFIATAAAAVLVVAKAEKVVPHDSRVWLRIVLTVILFLGAFVQLTNWRDVNDRLVQRLLNRSWGPRGPMNRREKSYARLCREVAMLLGFLWLAAAVFELLIATGVADPNIVV
jgi:hypothetical protein